MRRHSTHKGKNGQNVTTSILCAIARPSLKLQLTSVSATNATKTNRGGSGRQRRVMQPRVEPVEAHDDVYIVEQP